MDLGSSRPLVFQKLVYVGCVLDHVAVHMIASLDGYLKLSHKEEIWTFIFVEDIEFIWFSTQPRICAHLEKAPILQGEKVNRRLASNKRPPQTTLPPFPKKKL